MKRKFLIYFHLFGMFFFLALVELHHSKRCPMDPPYGADIEDWIAVVSWEASVPAGLLAAIIVPPQTPRCKIS